MPFTWDLPLFTFVAPGGFTAVASRPSDWSTGGISNEDGVEALCDSSFLQTSFHTEQVLSAAGKPALDIRKSMSQVSQDSTLGEAAEAPAASALSFFQVNEEVLSSDAGDGVTVAKEVALPGLDSELDRLKTGAFWLKAIFVLLFLWKGGLAFTRLLRRTTSTRRGAAKGAASTKTPTEEVETSVVPPESFRELKVEEQTPQSVPSLTALEVQQLLPAFSGYDCALSKPKSLGRPFRLRARIYGPSANVEPIMAPMTEEACVLCTTKVQLVGEATVILERSESVDFLANLEGAPDLQVMVNAKDVRTCMKSQSLRSTFESVPKKLQELVEAEAGLSPETPLVIQEDLLRVGDMVTLVGDLHRDAAGRLTIWPPTPPKREMNQVYELMDGMHVLISDEESFGGRKEDP